MGHWGYTRPRSWEGRGRITWCSARGATWQGSLGTVSVPLLSSSVPRTPVTGRDGGSPLSQAVRAAGVCSKMLILLIHEYVSPWRQGGPISGSPVSYGLSGFSFYNQAILVTYHQKLILWGRRPSHRDALCFKLQGIS